MKLRQFIILCLLVVIWFGYLGYKIDNKSDLIEWVVRNIDKNVSNMDTYYRHEISNIKYDIENIMWI